MKAFVSVLTLGLVMAFSAPAFAGSNAMAYVGDMISGKPAERINKLAHETLYDLMRRAASDVHVYQASHPLASSKQ